MAYLRRLSWIDRLGLLFLAIAIPTLVWAQNFPGQWVYMYDAWNHTTYQGNFVVKATPGRLHTICVNTGASSATVTVLDGSNTEAIINAASPGCYIYDSQFTTNLVVEEGTANTDVTTTYQ
jgi:hypothetical protein